MSEKKLQDYLPYYIGCKMMYSSHHEPQNEPYILTFKNIEEAIEFGDRPILRKLNDITDQEWDQIESETSIMQEAHGYQAVKDSFFNPHINYRFYWPIVNETLQILRKRNVDVDELIDSGLAIDASTTYLK